MQYSQASIVQCGRIAELVRDTITTVYPKYYPSEIVDFFCDLHNQRVIEADIKAGNVWVLSDGEQIVGTGSRDKNHITRVYVAPQFQGNGYGSHIMRKLEEDISRDYDTIYLDASLPATLLYETLGYRTIRHDRHIVDNGVVLVYAIMEKKSPSDK